MKKATHGQRVFIHSGRDVDEQFRFESTTHGAGLEPIHHAISTLGTPATMKDGIKDYYCEFDE